MIARAFRFVRNLFRRPPPPEPPRPKTIAEIRAQPGVYIAVSLDMILCREDEGYWSCAAVFKDNIAKQIEFAQWCHQRSIALFLEDEMITGFIFTDELAMEWRMRWT